MDDIWLMCVYVLIIIDYILLTYGLCIDCAWIMYPFSMDYERIMSGQVRITHRSCMHYIQIVYESALNM